jgi:hypothetical protein
MDSADLQINFMPKRIALAELPTGQPWRIERGGMTYPAANAIPTFENSHLHAMLKQYVCTSKSCYTGSNNTDMGYPADRSP